MSDEPFGSRIAALLHALNFPESLCPKLQVTCPCGD